MDEVKQTDIKLVTDAIKNYIEHIEKTKSISLQDFINLVEPKFHQAGYRKSPKAGDKINILIIHDAGVGDFVLQSGTIRELRRIYPGAHITLVAGRSAANLAEFCPYVNEIILNDQQYNPLDYVSGLKWNVIFAERLLTHRYHLCFAFVHNPITAALMYMSGAQNRISHFFKEGEETFPCHCNLPLRVGIGLAQTLLPMYNYGNHIVDGCFSLLEGGLRAPIENRNLEIWCTGLDLSTARNLIKPARRPLYAIVFGGNRMIKHYPPEKYAKVVEMIAAYESTATFVILGGGQADGESAQILKQNIDEKLFSERVIDLTNRTTYRQTAAVLSMCDMYIGNDTGALHVAAAVKCPCLAIFPFPADYPAASFTDGLRLFRPYQVPSVVVHPEHALPECAREKNFPYTPFGCRILDKSHCIAQILPEIIFEGFKILKEKISKKIVDTTYIC